MSHLVCPKCHGTMRQYERAGITIDQCAECRGIFLDRGEMERLVDAETSWHGTTGPGRAAPPPQAPRETYAPRRFGSDDDYHYGGHQYKRRKRSFIDDLFG
jgi:Zn-finger nucleic acid-binding protein